MTLQDIQKAPVVMTAAVAAAEKDPTTHDYIIDCLLDMFGGNYGTVSESDTAANNEELAAGVGRILARYEARHELDNDIYIISDFCADDPGDDSNHTTIMYVSEY